MSTPQTMVPIGFWFVPSDEEIIYYLELKVSNPLFQTLPWNYITECNDFYSIEPWNLPGANHINKLKGLFFYVPTKPKTENGNRFNRTAGNGYWRATSGDRDILFNGNGASSSVKFCTKALAYHEFPCDVDQKKQPSKYGKKKNWIMHEYRFKATDPSNNSQSQEIKPFLHWTICKISFRGRSNIMNVPHGVEEKQKEEMAQRNHLHCTEFERWCEDKRGKFREHQQGEETLQLGNPTETSLDHLEQQQGGEEPRQLENPTETSLDHLVQQRGGEEPRKLENPTETCLDHLDIPDFTWVDSLVEEGDFVDLETLLRFR